MMISYLIRVFGWRVAIECVGVLTMAVLFPVGIWITRSAPEEMGLLPDGAAAIDEPRAATVSVLSSAAAIRTANFWYILLGSTLVIGAIGAVIQHFILYLKDLGYTTALASRISTLMLASSLCGRIVVGYLADSFSKKNIIAFFYLTIGVSVLLLGFSQHMLSILIFAIIFGFAMGADYMLIPLVTAECFGTKDLGKILALIIAGYSLGQSGMPWLTGKLFDVQHSYSLAWKILAAAGVLGAAIVYRVSVRSVNPAGAGENIGASTARKLPRH
jgi:MFS family permease